MRRYEGDGRQELPASEVHIAIDAQRIASRAVRHVLIVSQKHHMEPASGPSDARVSRRTDPAPTWRTPQDRTARCYGKLPTPKAARISQDEKWKHQPFPREHGPAVCAITGNAQNEYSRPGPPERVQATMLGGRQLGEDGLSRSHSARGRNNLLRELSSGTRAAGPFRRNHCAVGFPAWRRRSWMRPARLGSAGGIRASRSAYSSAEPKSPESRLNVMSACKVSRSP
jgi:hypothetical protein